MCSRASEVHLKGVATGDSEYRVIYV